MWFAKRKTFTTITSQKALETKNITFHFWSSTTRCFKRQPCQELKLCKNSPDGHGHGGDPEVDMLSRAEVDGNEGEPDDTGGVHGEADELGLVEGLGDFASQDGVDGADDDQQDRIGEGDHVTCIYGSLQCWKKMYFTLCLIQCCN